MKELLFRTEDIPLGDIQDLFVPTRRDREIVDALKGHNPTLLVGSRGVGKSFLLRVAEAELKDDLQTERVLPVYVPLNKAGLLRTTLDQQFRYWTTAKLVSRLVRTLRQTGLTALPRGAAHILADQFERGGELQATVDAFEGSWSMPVTEVDVAHVPPLDDFKDAIEDLCTSLNLKRVNLFFDEATHVLIPEQQRQFFDLFRDLRSPYLCCNAAVYPGVSAYGDTFRPAHDATQMPVERDVLDSGYVSSMREIVSHQADAELNIKIAKNGKNFDVLAYAASGNPRLLLKTVASAGDLRSRIVTSTLRDFYRNDFWAEHSALAERYPGYTPLVDWGRRFIEEVVVPNRVSANQKAVAEDGGTSRYFWVGRDAPQAVHSALQLLMYTGAISVETESYKGTKGWYGTRYSVHLGVLFAGDTSNESTIDTMFNVAKRLSVTEMAFFGPRHEEFDSLKVDLSKVTEPSVEAAIDNRLTQDLSVLDVTDFQRERLRSLELATVGEVFQAGEDAFREAYYVGPVRARQMQNAAEAAVLEYLLG